MIALSSVAFLLGPILLGVAIVMVIPSLLAWQIESPDLRAFLISTGATAGIGLLGLGMARRKKV